MNLLLHFGSLIIQASLLTYNSTFYVGYQGKNNTITGETTFKEGHIAKKKLIILPSAGLKRPTRVSGQQYFTFLVSRQYGVQNLNKN